MPEDECRKQARFRLRAKGGRDVGFCQDYRGLNAITQRSVEPLPHVDQLVDETRGARFFTKLDLAMAYMQFRIREEDQYKTSFRVPGGQYEFRVGAFGLHGMSSVLMRYMHGGAPHLRPPLPDLRRLRPLLRSRPARLEPADAGALRSGLLR